MKTLEKPSNQKMPPSEESPRALAERYYGTGRIPVGPDAQQALLDYELDLALIKRWGSAGKATVDATVNNELGSM